jgi:hypothetical protein
MFSCDFRLFGVRRQHLLNRLSQRYANLTGPCPVDGSGSVDKRFEII